MHCRINYQPPSAVQFSVLRPISSTNHLSISTITNFSFKRLISQSLSEYKFMTKTALTDYSSAPALIHHGSYSSLQPNGWPLRFKKS